MNEKKPTLVKGAKAANWAKRLLIAGALMLITGLVLPKAGVSPMISMMLITLGSLTLIIAGGFGGTALFRSGGGLTGQPVNSARLAIVLGLGALLIAGSFMAGTMSGGAPIHDLSTDTLDPPQFVAVASLRSASDNPVEYSGAETAALQKEAYPDLEPIVLLDPRTFVFETALAVAEDMGWEIVASDLAEGRIEATATTPFVGFKDDVVIRIRARSAQTVVDVRSKSRVGRGDMGVNANRIREFSEKLIAAATP